MGTQLAAKLQPYLYYIIVAQLVLLCLAILVGGFLVLRRFFTKQAFEGDSAVDHERIAKEINQEILRLEELRNRIFPSSATSRAVSLGDPAPAVAVVDGAVDSATLAKFEEQNKASAAKLKDLETQLARAREDAAKAIAEAAVGSSTASAPAAAAGPSEAEIQARIDAANQSISAEKIELSTKVSQLEKVLAEYRIFEEDFALVKRYKTENEKLKKQLSETHQVTEQDISSLFESIGEDGAPAPAAAPKQNAPINTDGDSFFKDALAETLSSGASDTAGSAPSGNIAPATTTRVQTDPSSATVATGGNSDLEKIKSEPTLAAATPAPADMESLAESSVNDDALLEEFQKILGDKSTP